MEDHKCMTSELANSYRRIAKQWNIPESEHLVVLSIRGQMTEPCSAGCAGCLSHDECFPQVPDSQKRHWVELTNLIIGGF